MDWLCSWKKMWLLLFIRNPKDLKKRSCDRDQSLRLNLSTWASGHVHIRRTFRKPLSRFSSQALKNELLHKLARQKVSKQKNKLITRITRMIMIAINGHNLTMWLFIKTSSFSAPTQWPMMGYRTSCHISYFFSHIFIKRLHPSTKSRNKNTVLLSLFWADPHH